MSRRKDLIELAENYYEDEFEEEDEYTGFLKRKFY